jgi:YggT family protein
VILRIVVAIVEIYVVLLIVRALLSWIPMSSTGSALASIVRVLDAVTEPVLRPIRRVLPPVRLGGMSLDLSVLVVILVAELVVIPLLSR